MLLSVKDVATKYGYSSSQIRRLIRAGAIKATSLGAYYAIDEADISDLMKKRASDLKVKKKRDRVK